MPRFVLAFLGLGTYLLGQTRPASEIDNLVGQLSDAIRKNDFVNAADIAAKLDDRVQRQSRAWITRDASQRVDEVLNWLPSDIEAIWALQEPINILAKGDPQIRFGKPARVYALDRLMSLNGGDLYRRLDGKTVRLTVAAVRNIRTRGMGGVPGLMPDADAMYFYFLAEPLDSDKFERPDESLRDHPIWHGTAKIDAGEPFRAGIHETPLRDDDSWIALARPDLLILSSRREFLTEVLQRIDGTGPPTGSFSQSMPEIAQVDRRATFWGIRHYSHVGSRKDNSNPTGETESGSDRQATGVTVRYDTERGDLEIRYLSSRSTPPRIIAGMSTDREFQIEHAQSTVWQLKSSTIERGPFPFHFAIYLLGFGGYR